MLAVKELSAMINKLLTLLCFLVSPSVFSKNLLVCDFQTGAFLGTVSLGCGIDNEYFRILGVRGYTPKLSGYNDRPIETVGLKLSTKLWRFYTGTTLLYNLDQEHTFVKLPKQYPAGYYPMTGLRLAPHMGFDFGSGFFMELGTLDYLTELKVRNSRYVQFTDIVSAGFGFSLKVK